MPSTQQLAPPAPAPAPALPEAPRLFLVDGYALIYRAFYALISRPLTTSHGENTSAAWGIVNFLNRLLTKHRPEYLGWVHDSGLSFRNERYPQYKGTREKLTEDLQQDFDRGMERICDLLEAYRIPILALPGYEADDVIGTLARRAVEEAKVNVVVVSGDKDFQQLVRPGVWLLNPGRGGPASVEEQWVGLENASERLGVPPDRVTDYLALVGDTSDNVPGVPGIGDKTARELVNGYGDLEAILAAAPAIEKKRPREALLEHPDRARLSKELVTIRGDLPVTLELERLRLREPDAARLKQLLVELEFHTLAKEVAAGNFAPGLVPPSPADAPPPPKKREAPVNYVTVDTVAAMQRVVAKARSAPFVAVDTETVIDADSPQKVDPLRSTLVAISVAVAPGEAYYFPLRHRERVAPQTDLLLDSTDRDGELPDDADAEGEGDGDGKPKAKRKAAKKKAAPAPDTLSIAARMLAEGKHPVKNLPALDAPEMRPLVELLEDPKVRKTAQNAKYDVLALRKAGVRLRGLDFDTMLASYVLDPGRRAHGLDLLALEFLDHRMTSYEDLCGKGRSHIPYDQCPVDAARDYSCEDADYTLRLRGVFAPQLDEMELTPLFENIEMPLVDVLAEMECAGVSIDVPWFASLKERFQRERQEVERQIHEAAGREFNINSNPQLRQILFDELKLPVLKKTATGPSTDASVLKELAEEGHVLPTLLMEYRELAKLESTYLDTLPVLVNPQTGRLHTSFNQTVASTGRLSSSDPNLQNIPIRRELGRDIRRGFVPRTGWSLLAADYSQIELRLLAHLTEDPAFVEAFRAGGDIHRQTAAVIFDVPLEQVTSQMRARAKTINFATIYGQGPHALSRQLGIEFQEARDFIARYFERFQGVRRYLDSRVAFAKEHGYVETIFGRRRYIPELRDRNFNVRAFGERTATNSPIQGSAADLIKIAMIRIADRMRAQGLASVMILQVHDELVFEAEPSELDALAELVRREMEHAATLSVPLVVDIGVGRNWLETKE
ncbi:MAG TPA: DNA polymerase I [Gemmatimonadaceae bacterium]|nr:DNA polymerase I [Gemmatimonadaceae bacterium]